MGDLGAVGTGGTKCVGEQVGTLGTGWGVYQCFANVPSTNPPTPFVVIVRDAYDQFVCLQPPFAQADPLTDMLPILNSSGSPTSTMVAVATDSCGIAPLPPLSVP